MSGLHSYQLCAHHQPGMCQNLRNMGSWIPGRAVFLPMTQDPQDPSAIFRPKTQDPQDPGATPSKAGSKISRIVRLNEHVGFKILSFESCVY